MWSAITQEVKDGLDKWLKINCYLAFVWVFVDLLPYLPTHIVERIIEAAMRKLGI